MCVIYVWLRWVFTAAQPSLSLCERGLVIAVAYFVAEHRLWACRLSRSGFWALAGWLVSRVAWA